MSFSVATNRIKQSLTVSEASGGTAASSLGDFEAKDGNIEGMDLQDVVNQNEQFLKIF